VNGKYLLDTNIIIAIFAQEARVLTALAAVNELFIPCFAVGELRYGAWKSGRVVDNLARINQFVAENVILDCTLETTGWYGQIKDNLRRKGRPIPENDIWIAALAQQHDLILVTRDAHFQQIDDLLVEIW
jgi:tRNA(fMet)-specific endonuclease VapC